MKTVKVTPDNIISAIDVNFDDFRDLQKAVGGHFEIVSTKTLYETFKMPVIMLVDEDGQMSLYMQGGRVAEPQVSGQMSIEDVLAEWEKTKRAAEAALQEAEQRKLESAKARALQEAEELLGRLADVIPMLDSGLTPKDLLDQKYLSKDGQPNDSAVSMVTNMNQFLQQEIDRLSDENAQMDEQLAAVGASPVGDYMANAGVAAEDAAQNIVAAGVQELMAEEELPEIAMPEALAEADDTMEAGTSAEDVEAAILAETARQMAKESVEKEELPEIELPGDLDLGKEETAEEILPAIAEPEAFEVPDTISKLSKELREIFTYFVPITGMEEQLCQALTGASQHLTKGATAGTGNMIIQGGSGSGKTVLATSMIKALQKETGKPNGKIGKIEASVLNQKDVAALLKKVAGGCLIIEKAGDLSRETALKLSLLLEQDTSGVLVIIEDTKHGIQKALSRDDGFAAKFSEKINIPIFTSDELVSFAKSYANELGYTIDEMGVLALYNSISNIEHADRETTLTEVKEIVDKAVAHSEKGGLKKAFSIITSRRYDEDDYIILREKDFD